MFTLPPLPYADNALEPVISANTISFHYGKHHKTYVDNLNNLVKGTDYESATLEKIINETAGKADKAPLFNNAAQIWNHTFYWNSLKAGRRRQARGQDRAAHRHARSAATTTSRRNCPPRPCRSSAPAGDGWCRTAARSRS